MQVGLIILFVGLTFLARLVANAGLFPIEVRLTLVALAGAALLAVGFARRIARPAFGLALQGTSVAVMYLTVFAAAGLYGLLPPAAAFGLMILFAALGCVLALLQHARGLAFASFLGGFAVPLLLGGEADNPVRLFTYITILNLALLGIAWRRAWRELNLLGFFATFGMATLWGVSSYAPEHYLTCQLFLVLTMVIYVFVATLYAGHRPGRLGNAANTNLLTLPEIASTDASVDVASLPRAAVAGANQPPPRRSGARAGRRRHAGHAQARAVGRAALGNAGPGMGRFPPGSRQFRRCPLQGGRNVSFIGLHP